MLVMGRRRGECIDINGGYGKPGGVTVMVVDIEGQKVRLGITADSTMQIHRREVQQQIDREKE